MVIQCLSRPPRSTAWSTPFIYGVQHPGQVVAPGGPGGEQLDGHRRHQVDRAGAALADERGEPLGVEGRLDQRGRVRGQLFDRPCAQGAP